MAMYESNFLRLLNLVPDLHQLDGCYRSRVAGDIPLHFDVLERERYTLTLAMTYYFETDNGTVADPDMLVRVYLDGQQAEAVSLRSSHRHVGLQRLCRAHSHELNERWTRNVVFNKWLEYLLDQGHLILEYQA